MALEKPVFFDTEYTHASYAVDHDENSCVASKTKHAKYTMIVDLIEPTTVKVCNTCGEFSLPRLLRNRMITGSLDELLKVLLNIGVVRLHMNALETGTTKGKTVLSGYGYMCISV